MTRRRVQRDGPVHRHVDRRGSVRATGRPPGRGGDRRQAWRALLYGWRLVGVLWLSGLYRLRALVEAERGRRRLFARRCSSRSSCSPLLFWFKLRTSAGCSWCCSSRPRPSDDRRSQFAHPLVFRDRARIRPATSATCSSSGTGPAARDFADLIERHIETSASGSSAIWRGPRTGDRRRRAVGARSSDASTTSRTSCMPRRRRGRDLPAGRRVARWSNRSPACARTRARSCGSRSTGSA